MNQSTSSRKCSICLSISCSIETGSSARMTCWKRSGVGGSSRDSALTVRINAVRKALGDDGQTQRFVRTFPRKGIRFIAEAVEAVDPTSLAVSEPSDAVLPLPNKPSIAVLPFQNMSGDPEQDYFADGIVEEIITALSRSAGCS